MKAKPSLADIFAGSLLKVEVRFEGIIVLLLVVCCSSLVAMQTEEELELELERDVG